MIINKTQRQYQQANPTIRLLATIVGAFVCVTTVWACTADGYVLCADRISDGCHLAEAAYTMNCTTGFTNGSQGCYTVLYPIHAECIQWHHVCTPYGDQIHYYTTNIIPRTLPDGVPCPSGG